MEHITRDDTDTDDHNKATGSTKKNGEFNAECDPNEEMQKQDQRLKTGVQNIIDKITSVKWRWECIQNK